MGAALQGIFVGQGPFALPGSAEKLGSGRCGERTERCRWQRKRSERVAAVKILSVRRKAAQKFWAPQQGHRPLRKRISGCVGEGLCPSRGRPQGSPLRGGYAPHKKTKSSPAKPPRTMLCTVIPPCFAACSRRAASWSADTLPRCHGRTRPHLMPAGPRHGGSGAMFPRLFRARFHLAGLSLAV